MNLIKYLQTHIQKVQYARKKMLTPLEIFHDISPVTISQDGIFKYILIELKQANSQDQKLYFIRGNSNLDFHAQNFWEFQTQLKKLGYQIIYPSPYNVIKVDIIGTIYQFKVLGGGRIQHNYNGNKCFIYGYSKSYGIVDHQIAKQIISKVLSYSLQDIKTSQGGY